MAYSCLFMKSRVFSNLILPLKNKNTIIQLIINSFNYRLHHSNQTHSVDVKK